MSNQPEFLDVDAVAPTVRKVIKIKGKEYEFRSPTVGTFVDEMKRIKREQAELKKASEDDRQVILMERMINSMRDSVRNAFPDLPDDIINGLSMDQMRAIRQFMEAQIEEEGQGAEDAQGNG